MQRYEEVDYAVKCAVICFTKDLSMQLQHFHSQSFRIFVVIVILVVLIQAFDDAKQFIASLSILSS